MKKVDSKLRGDLLAIYEEMMWLAKRHPRVSASSASGWHTPTS